MTNGESRDSTQILSHSANANDSDQMSLDERNAVESSARAISEAEGSVFFY